MKILLERRSLQGEAHLAMEGVRGERLKTFLGILGNDASWSGGSVGETTLAGVDVFIVPTKLEPYTEGELDAIGVFVRKGGGLWILSNHDPFHEADGELASRFGVVLEKTFLRTAGSVTSIGGEHLGDHPVLESKGSRVENLVHEHDLFHPVLDGETVALLPETMRDKHTDAPPDGALYAHALQGKNAGPAGAGRVLTVADSGFLGDTASRVPGPGQIEEGDNIPFIRNAIRWLARA